MRFLSFVAYDVAKTAEVAKAADKLSSSPSQMGKTLAQYACLGMPFGGLPLNTAVAVSIVEAESADQMAAAAMTLAAAGAAVWFVPVLEVPVKGAAKVVKKITA